MSTQRYTSEFKEEAVRQVVERGHPVPELTARWGICPWFVQLGQVSDADGGRKAKCRAGRSKSEFLRLGFAKRTAGSTFVKLCQVYRGVTRKIY